MSKAFLFLAILSLCIFTSCSDNEYEGDVLDLQYESSSNVIDHSVNEAVAEFTIDNHNTKVFEKAALLLTNNSVNAVSYYWDFGNGETSTDANPTYSYELHGIFTITLVITDINGDSKKVSRDITVLCIFDGEIHEDF